MGGDNMKRYGKLDLRLGDCMDLMRDTPDNFYDLAIVDPPYGIGESGQTNKTRRCLAISKDYGNKNWDASPPTQEYFNELYRVSKNQIIWGANHFLKNTGPGWVVWNKQNGNNDFADCELAWTSFNKAVRMFSFKWQGMLQGNMKNKEARIHPTQKPVALYRWLLENYAKPGQTILDTHLGSMSIAIACYYYGCDLTGTEIDPDYYQDGMKRVKEQTKHRSLFHQPEPERIEPEQKRLF